MTNKSGIFRSKHYVQVAIAALALHLPMAHAGFVEGLAAFGVKNYAVALAEFKKGANQGDALSQLNVGAFYEHGLGVPKD